jgi:predicted secreted protein
MRALALCLVLLAVPAAAQEPPVTRLNLMETASREVQDDRYVAVLQGRAEAADAAVAQTALNRTMGEALAAVDGRPDVVVRTVAYDVREDRREGRPLRWVATQTLRLETADRALLLDRTAALQSMGLATLELGSLLSREGHAAERDALVTEAMEGIRQQAALVAERLGLRVIGYAEINLDGMRPAPMPRAMMMEARAADAPVMTEGTSTVAVTVGATVLLGG